MKRLLTVLLVTTLVAIPIRDEKWVLLADINHYPNDISLLRYCVADVEALHQALVMDFIYTCGRIYSER